ncbi:MAG: DUF3443 family protein [Terriglobales bacterium]
MNLKSGFRYASILAVLLPLAACGGSSNSSSGGGATGNPSTPSGPNVVPVVANEGVTQDYTNGLFTTVTVCVPGTTNCTTINNVLVDSGSYGLRLLDSQLANLPLPASNAPGGNPLYECAQYVSSYTWGSVATADVKIGGETASSVPIQVIQDQATSPSAPSSCSAGGSLVENDTQTDLGANGILGISVFRYDCGPQCSSDEGGTASESEYYSCPSSGCTQALIPIAGEVQNPVALFSADNNGELIEVPAVLSLGAPSVNGYLVFGIGTESNNSLVGETVLGADEYGGFETEFDDKLYQESVFDSGSNAIFFLDSQTLGNMPLCAQPNDGFYCPGATVHYTATNISADGSVSATATWSVANAQNLFDGGNWVFNNLAGPNPDNFDFGLAFFFGRTIAIGLNGTQASSGGNTYIGPFYGY